MILIFASFRDVRQRFGTSSGKIFMSQISSKNPGQLVDRLLCGKMLRVGVSSPVVKGYMTTFIEDTDALMHQLVN